MKKICIVTISLAKGGLERSCANLSMLLSENGYDVHLVTLLDEIDYDFTGKHFNLGKFKAEEDNLFKRLVRFRKLRRYFRKEKFDYILDNRIGNQTMREMYYILYIYGLNAKVIYMQHSGRLESHLPKKSILISRLVKYAYCFVGVSKGITEKFNSIYQTNKCINIYNFHNDVLVSEEDDYVYPDKYIIFLGRLDEQTKNFSLLLEAYQLSKLASLNVKLLVMGQGPDKKFIKERVRELGLSCDVVFKSFSKDIKKALSRARFLVLTSRYEGFPMVLVESLSFGIPVLSVDCISGPSEIIQNRVNGLLVENYSAKKLANAMQELYSNKNLYNTCKLNAKSSVSHLAGEVVVEKWKALLK